MSNDWQSQFRKSDPNKKIVSEITSKNISEADLMGLSWILFEEQN